MTLEQTIQSVPFMSVDDRLRLADAIWDSFGETDTPPLTPTQRSELDRRMADHDADPSTALNEGSSGVSGRSTKQNLDRK